MMAISLTLFGALIADQALKRLLRHVMGSAAIALGPCGQIRIVEGRLWFRRLNHAPNDWIMWALWAATAVVLVIASRWIIPSAAIFVGLQFKRSYVYVGSLIDRMAITPFGNSDSLD